MLDPQAQSLLNRVAAAGRPTLDTLSATAARQAYRESRVPLQPAPPEVAATQDRDVPGPHGPIAIRIYRPLGSSATAVLPALMYFHGGGFTVGDISTHDTVCRMLANAAGCVVISVDYRMGPEHKFPKAVDDCVAATGWVAANAESLRIDANRIAVGGDSAGGNLAAVTTLIARDAGGPKIAFQLLIYPTTTFRHDTPSTTELATGHMLTFSLMKYFRTAYLNGPQDQTDWRASPLLAPDLSRLPPALIITAGYDPIRDEGEAYAEKLKAAGVRVTHTCYHGMIHGFITMGKVLDAANAAIAESAAVLAGAFKK
ncbi:MAG: acetyl hydrolase, partial [Candidatus Muproteobacteria bacterium RBG_16_60_9]